MAYCFLSPWRSQHWFPAGTVWSGWCYRYVTQLRWCRRGRTGCWTERRALLTGWPEASPPRPAAPPRTSWRSPGPLWSPAWLQTTRNMTHSETTFSWDNSMVDFFLHWPQRHNPQRKTITKNSFQLNTKVQNHHLLLTLLQTQLRTLHHWVPLSSLYLWWHSQLLL